MQQQFLYQHLSIAFDYGVQKPEIPESITQNLNPTFELREYQTDAFARFIHCYNNDFPGKEKPLHLLFNMATGSGKTLIMAGLILYLYEKGYRNFLFFVNSTNIIEKTKDNFLNKIAAKYLFSEEIYINGQRVTVAEVNNFDDVNENDINICFATIQQLHIDMNSVKENSLAYEDFKEHQIVLLADEAHHMNVKTTEKQMQLDIKKQKPSWENTVEEILYSNDNNILLEFTATHDYEKKAIVEKYLNKVINRYDLMDFRNDQFSKEIMLVHSDSDQDKRTIQALIINQFKHEVAAEYGINLKPVILFKTIGKIGESQDNKEKFHRLLNDMTENQIDSIRNVRIEIIQKAFRFFDEKNVNSYQLLSRLRKEFDEEFCLSVNELNEEKDNQILINNLENKDNPIRVIFAVRKLDEGWDVLNLFDIVRYSETLDKSGTSKKTTISEAQLIGRGARYFPFDYPEKPDQPNRFRRKYDEDPDNELRVLELLHYHSINESQYVTNLRKALVYVGMKNEDERVPRAIKLKDEFKQTDFYKKGVIWLNKRVKKNYQHIHSFGDLGVRRRDYQHRIATGEGGTITALRNQDVPVVSDENPQNLHVREIERNIIKSAISRNPFFTFSSLRRYFPQLTSIAEFIASEDYLGGQTINLQGNLNGIEITRSDKLEACSGLLAQIELEIKDNITEYEGTKAFHEKFVNEKFKNKLLEFSSENIKKKEDPQTTHFVSEREWFVFDNFFGTDEERSFLRLIDRWISEHSEEYEFIYLIRNEGHFTLYNFSDGKGFEPDFVLYLHKNNGEAVTYQLFIEPKGQHIREGDRWKEEFLKEICEEYSSKVITEDSKFRVIGVPSFYNVANENEFRDDLNNALQNQQNS